MAAFEEKRKPEFRDALNGHIIVTGARGASARRSPTELGRPRAATVARPVALGRRGSAAQAIACDVTDEAGAARPHRRRSRRAGRSWAWSTTPALHRASTSATAVGRRVRAGRCALNATAVVVACARGLPAPEGGRRRADRQHRLVLRQARRAAQRRLLRLEGGGRRDHALPGRRNGRRDGIRVHGRGAGLHRDRPQPRLPRERSVRTWIRRRIPVGRPGTPEEVARLVGVCSESDIGFLTGETIYIDGGQGMNH